MVDIQQNQAWEVEQEGINPFNNPTPGESLTKNPDERFQWEQQPMFSDVDEAIKDIFLRITERDALIELLNFFKNRQPIEEMTQMILYRGFTEGEYNVDLMLLLVEPLMYVIMSIAEEANIDYNIDNDDIDEPDEEEVEQTISLIQNEFANIRKQIANKKINSTNLEGSVDRSLLNRVKEEGPNIRESLLEKGEEENE